MSDQDGAPDPMDKAYAEAEAMLDDEAARAARRARVLGAVAREAETQSPAVSAPPARRFSWPRGRWLAAACVAGLSVLVAVRLYQPAAPHQEPAPTPAHRQAAPATVPLPAAAPPTVAIVAPPPAVRAPAPAPAVAPAIEAGPSRDLPAAPAPAPPPAISPPPPPPSPSVQAEAAPTADAARAGLAEVVVTATRQADTVGRVPLAKAAPPDPARLRSAAAAGRISELNALLTPATLVDAADEDGETALMKAVRAKRAAAVAVLLRHGADPDLKNKAGQSARDMAASIADPRLDRALGALP